MNWKKNKKIGMTLFTTVIILISVISISTITLADEIDSIIISEIMYNPQGSDSDREWIEIYNTYGSEIDITGWFLQEDGVNHSLTLIQGSMNIPSNGFAVIANDNVAFLVDYPTYSGILIDSSFSLPNTGEYLAIRNETLELINDVNYVSQPGADDTNKSIEYDHNDDWFASMVNMGTPGAVNSVWEAPFEPNTPDPTDGEVNVELNPQLSALVVDPEDDIMVVEFYNASDNSIIGVVEDVGSNTRPEITWNGLSYDTTYSWYVIAYDNFYLTQSEIWEFTTIGENNPPNEPSEPDPEDGETDVSVNQILSWTGGDPDGDPVTYDVYLDTNSPPSIVSSNQSDDSYDPEGLSYETTYYWKIVAWDDQGASTEGSIWSFTTGNETILTIEIIKPMENKFYLRNREFLDLNNRTIVYGGIDINVSIENTSEIDRVVFMVDGNEIGSDDTEPYSWNWAPIISFKKTIKVIVYDKEGNQAEDEVEVFKWRFHPLLVIAGAAVIFNPNTKLIRTIKGYTVVRGIIFNPKQSGKTLTFRAINLHYTKVKLLTTETGVIRFKKCTIQTALPDTQISLGPFGKFNWIFCTYRGTQLETPSFFQIDRSDRGGLLRNLFNL